MTERLREWLPGDALVSNNLLEALQSAVLSWSHEWATGDHATVTVAAPLRPRTAINALADGLQLGNSLCVQWNDQCAFRLSSWVLGCKIDPALLTGMDRDVLLAFAEKVRDDFITRIERALGAADTSKSADDREQVAFEIRTVQGTPLLTLAVSAAHLVTIRKRQMPPPATAAQPLVALQAALGSQTVAYTAWLGSVALTASDLQCIEVGDVLVLEQSANHPVRVCLAHPARAGLLAHLQSVDPTFTLVLTERELQR